MAELKQQKCLWKPDVYAKALINVIIWITHLGTDSVIKEGVGFGLEEKKTLHVRCRRKWCTTCLAVSVFGHTATVGGESRQNTSEV